MVSQVSGVSQKLSSSTFHFLNLKTEWIHGKLLFKVVGDYTPVKPNPKPLSTDNPSAVRKAAVLNIFMFVFIFLEDAKIW